MSETIEQSQSENYSKSVGTSAVVLVKGGGNDQSGSGIVTVGGTINVPRSVVVHNAHASQVLYVGWGSDVTSSSGFPIAAGGYMEFELLFTDELWAVGSGAGTDARIFVLHGKGNPPFSPLDLSPTLWVDASDASTITESAGAVSQWDDKSGNGNDLTQAAGSLQPATGTSTLNALNVLSWDGDVMNKSVAISSASCVVIVVATWLGSPRSAMYGGPSGTDPGMYQTSNNSPTWVFEPTPGEYYTVGSSSAGSVLVAGHGTTSYLRKDGVELSLGSGSQSSTAGTSISQWGKLGRANVYHRGDIAEIIVVDGTLTAQQISDTETYLANKWGITI